MDFQSIDTKFTDEIFKISLSYNVFQFETINVMTIDFNLALLLTIIRRMANENLDVLTQLAKYL